MAKLSKLHDLSRFDGVVTDDDKDLDSFLKEDALVYQYQKTAITYLCVWKDIIVGYVTVCADCISVEETERKDIEKKFPHRDFPALKIARLLVAKDFRGRGVGKFMVMQISKLGLDLSEKIGIRILSVDAKKQAINFYTNLGFKILMRYSARIHPRLYFDLLKGTMV